MRNREKSTMQGIFALLVLLQTCYLQAAGLPVQTADDVNTSNNLVVKSRNKRQITNILDLISDGGTYYGDRKTTSRRHKPALPRAAYDVIPKQLRDRFTVSALHGQYGGAAHVSDSDARSGRRRKKHPKVVHLLDCHDDHEHDCHGDSDQHVISFDKHDGDYHDDYHDYHDHDYHGDYHGDYHDDYHDYHDHDYHDDYHGDYHDDYHDYGHKGYDIKKPKVVIIKKIISKSTTTVPDFTV